MTVPLIMRIKPDSSPWLSTTCASAIIHRNHFFHFYQQNKSESKKSSGRLVIIAKCFLKLPNLHMVIKQESITFQKLGSREVWQIANSIHNKGKSAVPPLFTGLEVLSSASDNAKLFAKNFSQNSNLDDSGVSLLVFPSRTDLKLHNISVTPKMVKKVIMDLDSSKASVPD